MFIRAFFVLIAGTMALSAQEVKFVDLTLAPQRTQLRTPPAPTSDGEKGVGGGFGGSGVGDGAPDYRDPHALGVYLQGINPEEVDPRKPFQVEFRVLNTGLATLDIPVCPDLSDLQPPDEAAQFAYLSIALSVRVEGDPKSMGYVQLYGSGDHDGTILTLKPGEWVKVKADIKLGSQPKLHGKSALQGGFWLHRNTFTPHPGGFFTSADGLYPNATPTPVVPVHFLFDTPEKLPKEKPERN